MSGKEPPGPKDYFLEGEEPDDDEADYDATPFRPDCLVEPFIDGVAAFTAMEDAIAGAKKSVYISFWIFNPATPVQSRGARTGGVSNWGDLLRAAAGRGAEVRLLLTDFDPLFADALHRNNWRAYQTMLAHAARLGAGGRDRLQVVVSRHPATASVGIGSELETRFSSALTRLNGKKGVDTGLLGQLPGLWRWLEYDAKKKTVARAKDASLSSSPAAHHQKLCIVDELTAFCGGLDVNTGRIDTPQHNNAATAWHDVQAKVRGPAALDICRNFVTRWNEEAPIFTAFRDAANKRGMPVTIPTHTTSTPLKLGATKAPAAGKSLVQVQRTLSSDDSSGYIPDTEVDDIADAYERAIGQAREFIYIENQYVRSPDLGNWIKSRAKDQPELRVIIVLPVAPEEVGAKGGADKVTLHGLYLQHEVLTSLKKELGTRFGVFSLVKRTAGTGHATDSCKSPQIYVHTKAVIIDDVYAMIGSANANPRSFKVDTELNVGWYDAAAVRAFRLKLWAELLGSPAGMSSWAPATFVDKWTDIAKADEKASPVKRQGLVVRHDPDRFKGTKNTWLPDAFADVLDTTQEQPDTMTA